MPSVEFLGVGDATDFERGQASALYSGSSRLLIDCGPQIPLAVSRRVQSAEDLDGIYLTHLHADHCFGLPSLLLWMRQNGRRRPLTLIAERGILTGALRLIDSGYPDAFSPSKSFAIEPLAIEARASFPWMQLVVSIAPTQHSLPNFALRIEDQGHACAFSGDGWSDAQTVEIFASLDLLVHECAFAERDSSTHANVQRLIALQRQVRPRCLAVTHLAREQRNRIQCQLSDELGASVVFPDPGTQLCLAQ